LKKRELCLFGENVVPQSVYSTSIEITSATSQAHSDIFYGILIGVLFSWKPSYKIRSVSLEQRFRKESCYENENNCITLQQTTERFKYSILIFIMTFLF